MNTLSAVSTPGLFGSTVLELRCVYSTDCWNKGRAGSHVAFGVLCFKTAIKIIKETAASLPSSFPELCGAASVASHQEPALSPALKCGWTSTPDKPAPGLVWLPPSPGYAPFDLYLPCSEAERNFTKHNKANMFGLNLFFLQKSQTLVKALWWRFDWPTGSARRATRWWVRGFSRLGPSCTCSPTAGCTVLARLLGPTAAVGTERHNWGRESRTREAG